MTEARMVEESKAPGNITMTILNTDLVLEILAYIVILLPDIEPG